jgi:ketosteroid isomerase-like protein
MNNLSSDAALVTLQLQQLLMEFAHEVDLNNGQGIGNFYTEDGSFLVGDFTYRGREAVKGFYRDRLERVKKEEKDGARTGRHTFVNMRSDVKDKDNAILYSISVHYSGGGKPPVPNLTGPTTIADVRMICRREGDGRWRIVEFHGKPIFLGGDQFLNKMLVKS